MEQFILQLGIMSFQAGVAICAVLFVRILFDKLNVAKKFADFLWAIPYLCMVCPWKFESTFGFWRAVGSATGSAGAAGITTAGNTDFAHTAFGSTTVGSMFGETAKSMTASADNFVSVADVVQILLLIAGIVWIVGALVLLLYSANAHLQLHQKLICCMKLKENIYFVDGIATPFVLGIRKPRIYLPSDMPQEGLEYVLAHERTHIRRKDPLKKMLIFGITCLHWFNPMVWVAFYYFTKDMEMACDEVTVESLGVERRQDYAAALLQITVGKKFSIGAPLAFKEGNVKDRIKNIVKMKEKRRLITTAAVVVIVLLAVGIMTEKKEFVPLSEVQEMPHPPKEETSVEYDIEQYFTVTLPEGTWLSNYRGCLNDLISGSVIEGDFEELPHDEEWETGWHVPGGVGIMSSDGQAVFENGELVSVAWRPNHSSKSNPKQIDGCEKPAVMYKFNHDLFTASSWHEYCEEQDLPLDTTKVSSTAKFWYVFMADEDDELVYVVYLNQAFFNEEDVLELARSVKFRDN